jgi:hypothetical protein
LSSRGAPPPIDNAESSINTCTAIIVASAD